MTDFEFVENDELKPTRIKVVGVGGGGSNAVDSMIDMGLKGVEFCNINTDLQALKLSQCQTKLHIGDEVTADMGCGGDPALGEKAALACKERVAEVLDNCDMVFIAAGLGGGTGTGAAPVIAEIAKGLGLLTVAIVTKPFSFEGPQRMKRAEMGLTKLSEFVDTKIVILNDKLIDIVGPKTPITEAFEHVNRVLAQGVQAISELISVPGEINVDFMDIRTIMGETGGAVMGVGIGKGENRASEAVKKACASPLQEKIVIEGARGVLISIAASQDVSLQEVNLATSMVYEMADPDANIIFGLVIDNEMKDEMRVTIIATGFPDDEKRVPGTRQQRESLSSPKSGLDLETKIKSMMSEPETKGEESQPREAPRKSAPQPQAQQRPAQQRPAAQPQQEPPRKPAPQQRPPQRPPQPEARQEEEDDSVQFESELPDIDLWEPPEESQGEETQENDSFFDKPAPSPEKKDPDKPDLETPAYLRRRKTLFE
ncbi:MAG: cell division protein FtsZ [Candidatus Sumerlaeia bacterium]